MKSPYLKPWTIVIVLACLLPVFFSSCKDDEEPYDPGCVFPVPTLTVELEKGSVIQMEDGEWILSESDELWKDVQGLESLKSVIYPYAATFETGPIDLSNSVGKRLKFTGLLAMIDRDTLIIEGERQAVAVCQLRNAEIKLSEGGRAGE